MLVRLFWVFFKIGLFAIGGGYATLPLISSEIVQKTGWLSEATFRDLVALSQMTPGPIALNAASFTGLTVSGIPGALAATFGAIAPSLIVVTMMGLIYRRYQRRPAFQGALHAMQILILALIGLAFLQIVQGIWSSEAGLWSAPRPILVLVFMVLLWAGKRFRLSGIQIMLISGCLGLLVYGLSALLV